MVVVLFFLDFSVFNGFDIEIESIYDFGIFIFLVFYVYKFELNLNYDFYMLVFCCCLIFIV